MENLIQNLENFRLPKYSEIPNMDLYMDQLLSYIYEVVKPIIIDENEKLLTTSMVNNYVKANMIKPTHKKRYSREHIAYLLFISIFKQIYTMNELKKLMLIQKDHYSLEEAYNYFSIEMENILKNTISGKQLSEDTAKSVNKSTLTLRTSIVAFVNKLYSQKLCEQIILDNGLDINAVLKNKKNFL